MKANARSVPTNKDDSCFTNGQRKENSSKRNIFKTRIKILERDRVL
jgi:hypothetical protein